MNDAADDNARRDSARRYESFSLPQDSSAVPAWMRQHALAHDFELDSEQNRALQSFRRLHEDLAELEQMDASILSFFSRRQTVRGIYLWGGVGRGKSFLMDSFFNCAPTARRQRIHFHRFMQEVHRGLNRHQGEENPLAVIARDIAQETRFLCLDEFHITDITDAMLMRRLLEGLFECGVVLVTTSNLHPDGLYRDGLQRGQFVPAIELIKRNLELVNVDGGVDYRLRELERAGVYHIGPAAEQRLEHAFAGIASHERAETSALEIENRVISVRKHSRGIAWFDFMALCDGPRGKADYIELACRFHTVIVSGIPVFGAHNGDIVRRFTWLVDEFYDRRVKLIVSAAASPAALNPCADAGGQFERTVSRLTEMQTHDYLAQPHLP